jgi:hypothetical protein
VLVLVIDVIDLDSPSLPSRVDKVTARSSYSPMMDFVQLT